MRVLFAILVMVILSSFVDAYEREICSHHGGYEIQGQYSIGIDNDLLYILPEPTAQYSLVAFAVSEDTYPMLVVSRKVFQDSFFVYAVLNENQTSQFEIGSFLALWYIGLDRFLVQTGAGRFVVFDLTPEVATLNRVGISFLNGPFSEVQEKIICDL